MPWAGSSISPRNEGVTSLISPALLNTAPSIRSARVPAWQGRKDLWTFPDRSPVGIRPASPPLIIDVAPQSVTDSTIGKGLSVSELTSQKTDGWSSIFGG